MIDALKSYVALASGLTEATAAKAKDVASALVEQTLALTGRGTDITGKVTDLADDLLATSKENREALTTMVRTEVDRAIGRVGFVREDELAALRRHVQRLDGEVADLRSSQSTDVVSDLIQESQLEQEVSNLAAVNLPGAVVEPDVLPEALAEAVAQDLTEKLVEAETPADIPVTKSKTYLAE